MLRKSFDVCDAESVATLWEVLSLVGAVCVEFVEEPLDVDQRSDHRSVRRGDAGDAAELARFSIVAKIDVDEQAEVRSRESTSCVQGRLHDDIQRSLRSEKKAGLNK
jgi:hypothetical protein